MRKLLLMGAIFLSQLVTTQVQAVLEGFEIEGRVAYLYPTERRIRDDFGKNGWAEYQLEVGMPLNFFDDCGCDSPIVGFFNASYFEKRKHLRCHFKNESTVPPELLCTDDFCPRSKARIEHWLLTAGAKYYFTCFECIRPYLGFGIGAAGLRRREHFRNLNGPNVILVEEQGRERHRNDKWGFALLAKSGLEYDITCNIFLDLFVDYAHSWFSRERRGHKHHDDGECSSGRCSSRRNNDFGAIKTGLGIGYRF